MAERRLDKTDSWNPRNAAGMISVNTRVQAMRDASLLDHVMTVPLWIRLQNRISGKYFASAD